MGYVTGNIGPSYPEIHRNIPNYNDKKGIYLLLVYEVEDTGIYGPYGTIGQCIEKFNEHKISKYAETAEIQVIDGLDRRTVLIYTKDLIKGKWRIGWRRP